MPQRIHSGQPTQIALEVMVFDAGGDVAGRFREVAFHYRLSGTPAYRMVPAARRIRLDERRERNEFTVPAFPRGTHGRLEYCFTFRFDGQPTDTVPQKVTVLVE